MITFASPGQQRVYDRIARGPCACVDIVKDCAIPLGSLGRHINELKHAKLIIEIGKGPQAGRDDLRSDSPIYALKGTPLLPPVHIQKLLDDDMTSPHIRPVRKVQTAPGSGVIAERRQPSEFRELRRDLFAHMKLAMLAR